MKLEMKRRGRIYGELSIYDECGRCGKRTELLQISRIQAYSADEQGIGYSGLCNNAKGEKIGRGDCFKRVDICVIWLRSVMLCILKFRM